MTRTFLEKARALGRSPDPRALERRANAIAKDLETANALGQFEKARMLEEQLKRET